VVGLPYVGAAPVNPTDIVNGLAVDVVVGGFTPDSTSVTAQADALIVSESGGVITNPSGTYVAKSYVDAQFANYVTPAYVATQDALLVPTTSVGVASGIASLGASVQLTVTVTSGTFTLTYAGVTTAGIAFNAPAATIQTALQGLSSVGSGKATVTGTGPFSVVFAPALTGTFSAVGAGLSATGPVVPLAQMPNLGVGYISGGWGPTATNLGTSEPSTTLSISTPLKIADWDIGLANVSFQPMVFLLAFAGGAAGTLGSQPVIEMWITNTVTAPTTYPPPGGSIMIGQGVGRWGYSDSHAVVIFPAPSTTGQTQANTALLSPTYNVWVTAWMYDLNNVGVTISALASAAVYLLRGSE
jgi:hypothetical protein